MVSAECLSAREVILLKATDFAVLTQPIYKPRSECWKTAGWSQAMWLLDFKQHKLSLDFLLAAMAGFVTERDFILLKTALSCQCLHIEVVINVYSNAGNTHNYVRLLMHMYIIMYVRTDALVVSVSLQTCSG